MKGIQKFFTFTFLKTFLKPTTIKILLTLVVAILYLVVPFIRGVATVNPTTPLEAIHFYDTSLPYATPDPTKPNPSKPQKIGFNNIEFHLVFLLLFAESYLLTFPYRDFSEYACGLANGTP